MSLQSLFGKYGAVWYSQKVYGKLTISKEIYITRRTGVAGQTSQVSVSGREEGRENPMQKLLNPNGIVSLNFSFFSKLPTGPWTSLFQPKIQCPDNTL